MEAMRNYAQHRSLPVQHLGHPMCVDEPGVSSSKVSFAVVPRLDTAQLEAEGDFKASVLAELRKVARHIPITPFVREYIEGIGEVQARLRAVSDPHVEEWEALLASVENRGCSAFPDHQSGLAVVAEEEEGIWPEIDYVFADPWKRRRQLRQQNRKLQGLSRRYVTSEVKDHDA